MKINKELLPLKLHFFIYCAGVSPVGPFLPTIAKQLGFTSVSVGWILTVLPLVVIFMKPLAGAIADKYKCQRLVFLIVTFCGGFFGFSIQWIRPLPTTNTALAMCQDDLFVNICSEKLNEFDVVQKLNDSLNSTVYCKATVEKEFLSKLFFYNSSQDYYVERNASSELSGKALLAGKLQMDVSLGGSIKIQNGCAAIKPINFEILDTVSYPLDCKRGQTASMDLHCDDHLLQTLITKPVYGENEIWKSSQFWWLLILMLASFIGISVSNTTADAITFGLLGKTPEKYGLQKIWAPLGWGTSSFLSGLLIDKLSEGKAEKDFRSAFYTMLILLSLDVWISSRIKVVMPEKSSNIRKDVPKLFRNPKVVVFAIWCLLCGVYFSCIWNFLFWYLEDVASANGKESQSWIKSLEGLILAVQCYTGEIPFFFYSGKIMQKIGRTNCMTVVLFAFGIRFLFYSTLKNPWMILPIEPLQGITYGLMYATMTTHASAIAPDGAKTTVQNLFSSLFEGVGTATGGLIGGYLVSGLGAARTFFLLGCSGIMFGFLHIAVHKYLGTTQQTIFDTGDTIISSKELEVRGQKEELL